MNKLHCLVALWAVFLICATILAVNTVLWCPAAGAPVLAGIFAIGVMLFGVTAALDCTND